MYVNYNLITTVICCALHTYLIIVIAISIIVSFFFLCAPSLCLTCQPSSFRSNDIKMVLLPTRPRLQI